MTNMITAPSDANLTHFGIGGLNWHRSEAKRATKMEVVLPVTAWNAAPQMRSPTPKTRIAVVIYSIPPAALSIPWLALELTACWTHKKMYALDGSLPSSSDRQVGEDASK